MIRQTKISCIVVIFLLNSAQGGIILKKISAAVSTARCGLHQIGNKIIQHDHHHEVCRGEHEDKPHQHPEGGHFENYDSQFQPGQHSNGFGNQGNHFGSQNIFGQHGTGFDQNGNDFGNNQNIFGQHRNDYANHRNHGFGNGGQNFDRPQMHIQPKSPESNFGNQGNQNNHFANHGNGYNQDGGFGNQGNQNQPRNPENNNYFGNQGNQETGTNSPKKPFPNPDKIFDNQENGFANPSSNQFHILGNDSKNESTSKNNSGKATQDSQIDLAIKDVFEKPENNSGNGNQGSQFGNSAAGNQSGNKNSPKNNSGKTKDDDLDSAIMDVFGKPENNSENVNQGNQSRNESSSKNDSGFSTTEAIDPALLESVFGKPKNESENQNKSSIDSEKQSEGRHLDSSKFPLPLSHNGQQDTRSSTQYPPIDIRADKDSKLNTVQTGNATERRLIGVKCQPGYVAGPSGKCHEQF